jgi:hypothetical protein
MQEFSLINPEKLHLINNIKKIKKNTLCNFIYKNPVDIPFFLKILIKIKNNIDVNTDNLSDIYNIIKNSININMSQIKIVILFFKKADLKVYYSIDNFYVYENGYFLDFIGDSYVKFISNTKRANVTIYLNIDILKKVKF